MLRCRCSQGRGVYLHEVRWPLVRLLLAFGGVMVVFVAATGLAEMRLAEIDLSVRDIAGNNLPGIQHLVAARTTLGLIEQSLDDYVESASEGESASREPIDKARRQLQDELAGYGQPVAEEAQQAFDQAMGRVFDRVEARDFAAAHARLLYDFGPARQALDEQLLTTIERHIENVYHSATRIGSIRQRSLAFSIILDAASVLLTMLAAWITLRTLRRYTQSLETQSRLLSRRADELEEFAGRVAHDVLSPLSTVSLSLSMAERSAAADEALARMVARGRSGLQRVEKIVDGLLAFARAGARPEPGARADLREAIDGVVDATRERAAEAGVEVRVHPFPPTMVPCSPGVLDSLVANLVRNAIKYMGDGVERRVDVRVLDRGPMVHVEVEDTGPGLPPSLEGTVFEPYVRGGSEKPGIGLGLATVKRIALAHGGQVGVRSHPGRGSCFWFELPRVSPTPTPERSP